MISKQGFQSRVSGLLQKWADRAAPDGYYNLGSNKLPADSPRALVIYATQYLHKVLYKQPIDLSWVNSHSGIWESMEMLRLLNEAGYIVDYFNTWKEDLTIDWNKYELVIDERNNLPRCDSDRPVKVYYSTGVYWLKQNIGESTRVAAFLRRTGIKTLTKRYAKPLQSDEFADLVTHFGSESQLEYFTPRYGFVPLDISCVTEPHSVSKDMSTARNHFVWFGGAGFLHKGVDVAIEAFKQMPNTILHILGGINEDKEFNDWLNNVSENYPNIIFHGWMDTESDAFNTLLSNAIGVMLPSASETGSTSVPQAMHFGLLPIVTSTVNLRCPNELSFVIDETESDLIIAGLLRAVQKVQALSNDELTRLSKLCRAYAQENFSKKAYTRSFKRLLARVDEVRKLKKLESSAIIS